MVLQIATDLRRIERDRNANASEMIGWPDACQHQELGRVDGTAAQDDLALGPDRFAPAPSKNLDPTRPVAFDNDPHGNRPRQHVEVTALPCRLRISQSSTDTAAVRDIGIDPGKALGHTSVQVIDHRKPRLAGGGKERIADRQIKPRWLYRDRTGVSVPLAGTPSVGLGLLEVGQHLIERPAVATKLRPLVIFEGVAAQIKHAVDAARAAEDTPLKP